MKKVTIIILILTMAIGLIAMPSTYKDELSVEHEHLKYNKLLSENDSYIENYSERSSYFGVYQDWIQQNIQMPSDIYTIGADDMIGGLFTSNSNSFNYNQNTIKVEPLESFNFVVDITEAGLYEIYFDYYLLENTFLKPTIAITVNGNVQYNEMYDLELPIHWEVETEILLDRFGDEIIPDSHLKSAWRNIGISDPNHFFNEPLKFYLSRGENEINITVNEGYVLFGEITIGNLFVEAPSYELYYENIKNQPHATQTLLLQAQDYTYESRKNIRAKFLRNPKLTPYSYKQKVLNVLDEASYRKSGDSVIYTFDVEESGLYQITFKHMQSLNDELSSTRRILINGEVPFHELESYHFSHSMRWKNETLGENGVPYFFYFEVGTHTLELAVTNQDVATPYHRLVEVLNEISRLAREVQVNTGGLTDRYRDYKLDIYIPNIIEDLEKIRDDLITSREELIEVFGKSNLAIISEINISIQYMEQFIKNPNEIPPFLSRFNVGDGSAFGRINMILPLLIDQPLALDVIYIHADQYKIPRANANIFVQVFEGLRSFFYSFFDPKYNQNYEVDEQTVEIWVRNSRLYIEVMQRMLDEQFTPQSGIKVILSVMPDENKIILANAAGNTPDAAMGLSVVKPFDFAIREMLVDLSQFDNFAELATEFNPNSFIPYVYEDGVYSIPETQDVKLLFYRKDVLDFLNTEPPETWDEVISLIAVMQKYNYSFYTPLGSDNAFKTFGETMPFVYQFGGEFYNETGDRTTINIEGAYNAFEFMTDLFSVYNVPITTSNFFQKFRDGTTPIGIGDGNTYIQLKYAAPELAGQWGVTVIPGVEVDPDDPTCTVSLNNEGRCILRWDPTYGISSVIFSNSQKTDLAWEYFSWWFSKEVQSDFTYKIQSLLGEEFLHMTANIEAFKTSAWPSDTKSQVLEQWQWVRTTGRVPGDYLLERELSNAWNKVVHDGANPRVAIDDAVVIINRELRRKLTEFGYYEDGVLVKPYPIVTNENIHLWLGEKQND